MKKNPIYVTRPHLPPLDEFIPYLEGIWSNQILTNCGPYHQQLEDALCEYLGVKYISLFTNATIALMAALRVMHISGEVITTPYSFVATSHAIAWNSLKPVFVDIDPESLNIDPGCIEAAITPHTTAILPVHCYGRPCDVDAINRIAERYNLKVIYDAAHAFGVEHHSSSVLQHGDMSVLSFHATKVFNTFEGGAIVCPDFKTKQSIDRLKNFGFIDEVTVASLGINGKMSEVNAAFGLLQLRHIDVVLKRRAELSNRYLELLFDIPGIRVVDVNCATKPNYAYFPILVEEDYPLDRDALYAILKASGIHARRYFFPLISDLPMYKELPSSSPASLPVAHRIARQVICLPLYPMLEILDIERIVGLIRQEGIKR